MNESGQKNALVTGGASGLGLQIALALAARGYRCLVVDVSRERLAALPEGIEGWPVDVTDEAQVVAAVRQFGARLGPIHVLVNNAGTIFSSPLINLQNREQQRHDYGDFRRNIDINLNAVFLVGSVVAEAMVLSRTPGVIVNISSVSALGNAGQSAYSAAKAGVEALTRVWAKELGPLGIRAVAIAPGFMDTASTHAALSKPRLDDITRKVPLLCLGAPEHVVQAVLLAIECDYLTGTTVRVDGGISL
jgi:3-oxoacyl-[acyl-carrier protein] reductase